MCYLSDVPPRCGGTTFWPGSHKLFYQIYPFDSNGRPTGQNQEHADYRRIFDQVLEEVEPVEICGEAGDVVWCAFGPPDYF